MRAKQCQSAEIDGNDRERPEQHTGITPAERVIAEAFDRQRDELLCQWRVHRIEQRRRWLRRQHLPCGGHVMHFVKIEFIWRADPDQKYKLRNDKYRDGEDDASR